MYIINNRVTSILEKEFQNPAPTEAELNTGLLWMFPGIEGGALFLGGARRAFREAGYRGAIYTYKWKYLWPPEFNLMAYKTNLAGAIRTAEHITDYCKRYPKKTVHIVAYSGGAGVAVMAVERLAEENRLRNVVLVQPAISPDYNLTETIRHIDGKLINFYSEKDWFYLGIGTRLLGTIDRKNTVSAGLKGFALPAAVRDSSLLSKFEQRPWTEDMKSTGHHGGHMTIVLSKWNKKYVSPYLFENRGTD